MKEANPDVQLERDNLARVSKSFEGYKPPSEYAPIVMLLADIVDTASSGRTCYATFGISKSGDLIMLTITHGGSKLYASGRNFRELAEACKSLL